MSDVFMILVCLVLLTLTLAIAVKLGDQAVIKIGREGEGFSSGVTSQDAYEESVENGTGPVLTGSYDQKTNHEQRTSPRTSQIMERELINPQLET
jgi:hypothetical protein